MVVVVGQVVVRRGGAACLRLHVACTWLPHAAHAVLPPGDCRGANCMRMLMRMALHWVAASAPLPMHTTRCAMRITPCAMRRALTTQDQVMGALKQAGFNLDPPAVAAMVDVSWHTAGGAGGLRVWTQAGHSIRCAATGT